MNELEMSRASHAPPARDARTDNVVGFLARSRDRLLLPLKVGKWKHTPSATTLNELVQALLRLGEVEQAWEHARDGFAKFKDNELVRELHRITARAHAELGLKKAQVEVREKPSSTAFLRLARCAVILRDIDQAFHALDECIRRFPTSAHAYAALSELIEQRWLRDLAAADGRSIVNFLRKAWRLDGADATRPLRLAAFLGRIGAQRSALEVVEEVLQIDEKNADAVALQDSLVKYIDAEIASGRIDPDAKDDIDSLLRQIEEQGRVVTDPNDTSRVARETEKLRSWLPLLRKRTGCVHVLVLEPKGGCFDERGQLGSNPLTTLVANLARSAQITARRADLGPLLQVQLETAGGALMLQRAQRCAVGLLVDDPSQVAAGNEALIALVEGRLISPNAAALPAPAPVK
jgi:tetratricopeptide (TPR) repeat protein